MSIPLLRKEVRELWLIVFISGAMLAAACLPTLSRLEGLPGILFALAGALLGAESFARETAGGTLAFLTALPVSRRRIWAAKAVTGFGALAVLTAVLAAVMAASTRAHGTDAETGSAVVRGTQIWFFLLARVWLSYAAALLVACLIRNAALAAAGGMALMMGIVGAVTLLLGVIRPTRASGGWEETLCYLLLVLSVALLSAWLFVRGFTVEGEEVRG